MRRRGLAASLSAVALAAACAGPSLPPAAQAPPPAPGEMARSVTSGGITLRAEPVTDPSRQQQIFGTPLATRGIIALLVSVENGGPATVDLRGRDLFLEVGAARARATSPAMIGGSIGEGAGVTAAGIAGAALLGIPGMLAASAAASESNQRNLHAQVVAYEAIGLRDGTLGPRGEAHGYVFFTPPSTMGAFDGATLVLRVRPLGALDDMELRVGLAGLGHRPSR